VEDLYFFSADGRDWRPATPPEECIAGYGIRAVGSGFIQFGGVCIIDGAVPPGPMRVAASTDGRSWSYRIDEERFAEPWTTDGERIVMLVNAGSEGQAGVLISDDGAGTWREIPDAFPVDVSVYSVAWGHGRYVAAASWLNRPGDPDHAVCASDTGDAWTCQVLSPTNSTPGETRVVGTVVPTSTGFASLAAVLDNPSGQASGVTTVLATSTDGRAWSFMPVPAMKEALIGGLLGTSHGVFTWGSTLKTDGTGVEGPYLLVHLAPLP
jgi:hypothetical protein